MFDGEIYDFLRRRPERFLRLAAGRVIEGLVLLCGPLVKLRLGLLRLSGLRLLCSGGKTADLRRFDLGSSRRVQDFPSRCEK